MVKPERERSRRRSARSRAAWAAVLAVLSHGLALALLALSSALWPRPPPQPSPQPVALRVLDRDEWDRNRRVNDSSRAQGLDSAAKEKKREPEPTPEGQVVDVAPGNNQQAEDARFLAPTANKVEQETRAKQQTAFYRNAAPQRTRRTERNYEGTDQVDLPMQLGNGGLGADLTPPSKAGAPGLALEIPSSRRQHEIALRAKDGPGPGANVSNQDETADFNGNSDRLRIQPGDGNGGAGASLGSAGLGGIANLLPAPGVLNQIAGAAPNDYLDDVQEGEGTFLNTKEWKYSGFFNRVKQSVGMQWDPNAVLQTRDPTGNIYSGRDRFTLVQVTLDDRGALKNISVEKSCGLDFLDLEAVHSFERAQPFPNPPPGLLSADATVRFEFGFFLDMSGGPKLRLFRQAY